MQVALLESQLQNTTAEAPACQDGNTKADTAEGQALPLLTGTKQLEDQVIAPVHLSGGPVTSCVVHYGQPKVRAKSLIPW